MTGMLASVADLDEAIQVAGTGVDIIDLKAPAAGALGALKISDITKIKHRLGQGHVVSATIGDLPMDPETVTKAAADMQSTGVDYIKIGFFPGGDWLASIQGLAKLTDKGARLIAVLFGDNEFDLHWIERMAMAGFSGVMLDTMNKSKGALPQVCSVVKLKNFIAEANRHRLLVGLAGSLRIDDIPLLLDLHPDYLGFRGALCKHQRRVDQIDPSAVRLIRESIPVEKYQQLG